VRLLGETDQPHRKLGLDEQQGLGKVEHTVEA
jgi:hypothetical protein